MEQLRSGIGREHNDVLSSLLGAVEHGEIEALVAILRRHARSRDYDGSAQASRCRSVIGYAETNALAMTNHRNVPMADSGPAEKASTSPSAGDSRPGA